MIIWWFRLVVGSSGIPPMNHQPTPWIIGWWKDVDMDNMDRIKTSFIDNYTIIFGAHRGNRVLTHTQMPYTHYDFIPTKACNWFHLAAYSPILIPDILIFLYIYIHNVDQCWSKLPTRSHFWFHHQIRARSTVPALLVPMSLASPDHPQISLRPLVARWSRRPHGMSFVSFVPWS